MSSVEDKLARRIANRVGGLVHKDLCVLNPIIHDHIHQNSAAGLRKAGACAVHLYGLDDTPLTARSPVAIKLVEGIVAVVSGMLRPGGIVHPDAVGRLEIL